MGHIEDLRHCQHFRGLPVIPPDLNERLFHSIGLFCALCFYDGHGNTVDEKHDIRAVCFPTVRVLPFISHLKHIAFDVVEVNYRNVAAPLFVFIVNCLLSPEPGQDFCVPLDIVPDGFHAVNNFIHIFLAHQSLIQFQQLFFKNPVKQHSAFPFSKGKSLFLGDDLPVDFVRIFDDRVLHG